MGEDTVSVELPASDWESLLSVLKLRIREEKQQLDDNGDTAIVDTLTLLYEEIDRQMASNSSVDRVDGLSFEIDRD